MEVIVLKSKIKILLIGLLFTTFLGRDDIVSAYERSIEFSGYQWEVRQNNYLEGPGPNYFSDSLSNVWVDSLGRLHLKLTYQDGKWYGAEVIHKEALGFGEYTFYLEAQLDQLDPNVVLGLFTYDIDSADASMKAYREMDIEFAKWGNETYPNSQYTIWNPQTIRESHIFDIYSPWGNWSTHSFKWKPNQIFFESLGGHYAEAPNNDFVWQRWNYNSHLVPDEGLAKIHMNLWLVNGQAPKNNQEVEVIISNFTFEPYN